MSIASFSRKTFIFGSLASASALSVPAKARARTAPLRVLTIASGPGALPLFARDNGFFTTAGLNIDVTTMNNGAAILAAVAGGAVEIGEGNAGSIAAGFLRGIAFNIIADGGLYDAKKPITLLCVAHDSPISTAKDLNGKTVALNGLKQVGQAGMQLWLDENGADSKSVGFVEMPFSPMQAAVESGRVDAAMIAEPALARARGKLKIIAAPFDAIAPVFSYAAFTSTRDWVTKNTDLSQRFSSVIRRTAQWANDEPHAALMLLAKYIDIPASLATSMTPLLYATKIENANLQPVIDVMAKYGYLPSSVDAMKLTSRV
jgi:NitT/TauT family transport system substrate-binding protein